MVYTKDRIYKMAYVELYEVLTRLNESQSNQLPTGFIDMLKNEMDKDYVFTYDESIDLEDQNFMTETKALIVEIYERYLCPPEENELWKKYDKLCLSKIEEKRAEQYNKDNLFKNKKHIDIENNHEPENLPVEVKQNGICQKIIIFVKKICILVIKKFKN